MAERTQREFQIKKTKRESRSKSLAGSKKIGNNSSTRNIIIGPKGAEGMKSERADSKAQPHIDRAPTDDINIVSQGISDKVKVCVRVRPPLRKEFACEEVVSIDDSQEHASKITIMQEMDKIESHYDQAFSKETSQEEIFEFTRPAISGVIDGFNATVFAYGQTGSGKTYTMFGPHWETSVKNSAISLNQYLKRNGAIKQRYDLFDNQDKYGIIPRAIQLIFDRISEEQDRSGDMEKYTVYCSFLQIYNENLYDLLQDGKLKNSLNIREDKITGIYVEGLAEFVVNNSRDCFALMKRGEKNRITKSTKANIHSSRSHSIFQLCVETDKVDKRGMLKRAKLNLCDLAGSEKIINKEESMTKAHFNELRTINLSLTTLGKVIAALSSKGKNTGTKKVSFYNRKIKNRKYGPSIPYRESKLTRLLQDSLGGNTRTCLICAVSPMEDNVNETISTLKFADRAKQVMVKVKANELDAADNALVQKLHKEVVHLRQVLNLRKKGKFEEIQLQLLKLQKENNKLKTIAENHEEVEKLKMENKYMRIELQKIKNEEGSQIIQDDGDISFTELNSNVHKTQPHELSSMRSKNLKEIERRFDPGSPTKCPLCNDLPPCTHYNEGSDYEPSPMERTGNLKSQRLRKLAANNNGSVVPNLARSKESLMDESENPYNVMNTDCKFNTGIIETRSATGKKVKLREGTSNKGESRRTLGGRKSPFNNREYQDYGDSSDAHRNVSPSALIKQDNKFKSQNTFEKNEKIFLPTQNSPKEHGVSAEDEIKNLMSSSQFSAGSRSTPKRAYKTDGSSAVPIRESKYSIFPGKIGKPQDRDRVASRELIQAADSIMSKDLSISQERTSGQSPPSRVSAYAPKSSEMYPSVSTDHNSSSTIIRIRDKSNYIVTKKGNINQSSRDSYIGSSSTEKRKDILKAQERLRKIEMIEQKRIGKVKEEIIKLEQDRKRKEAVRKQKRKELLERKHKLLMDRKRLEMRKIKRLQEKDQSQSKMPDISLSSNRNISLL
ncbi:unnamed protein product [Moneuplotes crassus]|uniref:Kinesin motor domain-containing protein n=3 Tax=Euplotes crassus TaxID=5936 RepID=A0AAD1XTL7_EUPCR|nr:unnamed protein product [Moneuplotes crassus]